MDPYLVMFITFALMFGVGYLLQGTVLSNLLAKETAREPISVLLFTAGLGTFLTNVVLSVAGASPLTATTKYSGKMIALSEIFVSVPKLISFAIACASTLTLYFVLMRTEVGRAIRATAQNRDVATLMGINQRRIYNLAFGISIGLVGMAGALLIPFYSVSTTVGVTFSFKAFIIVVLGGKGSVPGALIGGFIVGIIEKMGGVIWSDSVAQLLVFVIFIIVLLFRPNGLMGEKDQ
jgi:branched-chain amino acid transport system permease protein